MKAHQKFRNLSNTMFHQYMGIYNKFTAQIKQTF